MARYRTVGLMIHGGPDDGRMIYLSRQLLKFGRGALNDVVADDKNISREHAAIQGDSTGYWIKDLDSRNGTYVNGECIGQEKRRLQHQDRVQLGSPASDLSWVLIGSNETTEIWTRPADTQVESTAG